MESVLYGIQASDASLLSLSLTILNEWLMELTSRNFATTIVAVMMTFLGTYSTIFIRRIFREIMQLKAADSNLLTFLLFSFAYVLLVTFVDDHFGMSLFSCR